MSYSELNQLLQNLTNKKEIPAISIAIAKDDTVVFSKQYGRIYETGRFVDASTQFDIASMTKILTSISFMQMVENKLISLDDTIGCVFPELNTIKPIEKDGNIIGYCDASKITWFDALTHTTGMGWTREKTRPSLPHIDSGLEDIFNLPFAYQPHTKVVYSDLPIILMGKEMKKILGKPLDDIVNETIIAPLNLNNTSFRRISNKDNDFSNVTPTEYDEVFRKKRMWGEVHDENAYLLDGVSAHAGIFSTAEDMCKLAIAYAECLNHDGIIKKETATQMIMEHAEEDGDRRGLMWQLSGCLPTSYTRCLSSRAYGHAGFTGCFLWNDPEFRFSIVLLTNDIYNGRANRRLFNYRPEIMRLVFEE